MTLQFADNTKARRLDQTLENPYKKTSARQKIRSQMEIYEYLKKQ